MVIFLDILLVLFVVALVGCGVAVLTLYLIERKLQKASVTPEGPQSEAEPIVDEKPAPEPVEEAKEAEEEPVEVIESVREEKEPEKLVRVIKDKEK